jgi:hypothetical protein
MKVNKKMHSLALVLMALILFFILVSSTASAITYDNSPPTVNINLIASHGS